MLQGEGIPMTSGHLASDARSAINTFTLTSFSAAGDGWSKIGDGASGGQRERGAPHLVKMILKRKFAKRKLRPGLSRKRKSFLPPLSSN